MLGSGMLLTLSWVADCEFWNSGTCWDEANRAQNYWGCHILVPLDGFDPSLERLSP